MSLDVLLYTNLYRTVVPPPIPPIRLPPPLDTAADMGFLGFSWLYMTPFTAVSGFKVDTRSKTVQII